jgi:putative peptide zinc metalloprotease protein
MSTTFSESWHRVGALRVSLRPQVRVHRQYFRGERWFILHDPFNSQFFRLRPSAYAFVARLGADTTVEQAWRAALEEDPENAPGQQDAVGLLAQLYASNLIQTDAPADTLMLFNRLRKRRRREVTSKVLGAMFARFPLWDPDAFLDRIKPVADRVFSRAGLVVWAPVLLWGAMSLVGSAEELWSQSQRVLEPANLPWLMVVAVVLKITHEFGHMCLTKKFGGGVHTAGVLLMLFTPLPYADTTSAWSFRRRRERLLVGAGGMIVELFIAALAAVVWARAGDGLVRDLAFNVMLIGSVSTLLFNLNPLLRFDGYYLLADWLEMPNLYQRSLQQLRWLAERHLFGLRKEQSPAHSRREAVVFVGYGIAGAIYRIFLFGSILLFVWDRFLLLGVIMGVLCFSAWVVVPLGRLVIYLSDSPKLHRRRGRAVFATLGAAAAIVVLVRFVPLPEAVRAPGIVEAEEYTLVAATAPGKLVEVLAAPGVAVVAGQPLVRLEDPMLVFELRQVSAQLEEARARERQTLLLDRSGRRVIEGYREVLEQREAELRKRESELVVVARHAGNWVAPDLQEQRGRWVPRGTILGEVVNPESYRLAVRVPATRAPRIFAGLNRPAGVRLGGQPGELLRVTQTLLVAAAPEEVSPGGSGRDDSERSAEERMRTTTFEVRAKLAPARRVMLLHGQHGEIRFALPPRPLWHKASRLWQELFEKPISG